MHIGASSVVNWKSRNLPKLLLPPTFSLSLYNLFSFFSGIPLVKTPKMSKIRVCIFPISHWRAARIFFSFLVFSGTQSHLHAQKISTLSDQPSMFIEKNTHFCYIIHLKIISYKNSVSSTPFAKKNHLLWSKNARVIILNFCLP